MTKFLFDAIFFGLSPFHSVTACAAAACVTTFLLFQTHGLVLGTVYSLLCYGMLFQHGLQVRLAHAPFSSLSFHSIVLTRFARSAGLSLQATIVDHAWRAGFGCSWGAFAVATLSYRWHIAEAVASPFWKAVFIVLGAVSGGLFLRLHLKPPQAVQPQDREDLMQRILASAPPEGPVDPNEESDGADGGPGGANDEDLSGRGRGLGLGLTPHGSKKTDHVDRNDFGIKTSASGGVSSSSSGVSGGSAVGGVGGGGGGVGSLPPTSPSERDAGAKAVKFLLQDGGGATTSSGRGPPRARTRGPPVRLCASCLTDLNQLRARGVAHCASFDACVVGIEGFHDFVGTCVGRGNRRLFAAFLAVGACTCAVFVCLSLAAHWRGLCPRTPKDLERDSLLWNWLMVELCVFRREPAAFGALAAAAYIGSIVRAPLPC